MIHPTAIIEDGAQLGADCEIHAHAIITRHAILGDGVVVHPFSVIGGDPQYLRFDKSTPSIVRVGARTVFREHVTVNRSIHADKATELGAGCFLMAASHVAHDCLLGDNVVLANQSLIAGHVSIGDNTFVGGAAAIHQFVRVGEGVMVGGLSRITRDIAHNLLIAERDEVSGLNVVGLRRRGVAREAIKELKSAFHEVFGKHGNIRRVASEALLAGTYQTPEARRFLEFFGEGKRSFARPARVGAPAAEVAE